MRKTVDLLRRFHQSTDVWKVEWTSNALSLFDGLKAPPIVKSMQGERHFGLAPFWYES
ncbi:hypothetical protein KIN20_016996 [Parelaphostrongylus tenuis]|uniref:Uncharacterized protein n=1 Tax=Parelaphostrongylus tenuis TaxID=148309 RepID=A0AAD5N210_PARTN|nr:hypothetical protein KIN20_016996 [Parelaphostrongylus tenuis]